jgi:hypothetical protein
VNIEPASLTVHAAGSISGTMRASLLTLPVLGGCLSAPQPELPTLEATELQPATRAFELALPHQALALLDDAALWLPAEPGCPEISVDDDGVEHWLGGCTMADGNILLGSLERFEGPRGAWVAGDGLQLVSLAGGTRLYFDGAVELHAVGEIAGLGAAYSACGLVRDCELGPATVDLALTLYPSSGVPLRYDVAVDGVVMAGELDLTEVSGAYSVDLEACPAEPASGSLLLSSDSSWALDFDGATACDGCAAIALEGLPIGPGCADWLAF